MMKVGEVAKRLNLSGSKVYQLVEAGKLEHYRIDGTIRVSEEQLASFLESSKRGDSTVVRNNRPQLRHVKL